MTTKYFLLIDGLNGGSTDKDHLGWFEIDSYYFDVQQPEEDGGGGSGGTVGRAIFSPLNVSLNLDSGLAGALRDVAAGKPISAIKLEGVTESGDAIYDLTLTDVVLTRVSDVSSGDDELSFDGYRKIGLITQVQDSDGTISPGSSFGFDLVDNKKIDPTTLATPVAGTQPISTQATAYYLLIEGLKGDARDEAHKDWFEINNYSFDLQFPEVPEGGSGGSQGKAIFSPLSVEMSLTPGLAGALTALTGKAVPGIRLEGVTWGEDGSSHTVYQLTLEETWLTDVHDGYPGVDRLVFDDYARMGLRTYAQEADGSVVPAGSFGFDVEANRTIDAGSLHNPAVGNKDDISGGASKFFLLIDGLNGGSLDEDHKGWFEINDYSFDVMRDVEGFGSEASASAPTFSPLSVSLDLDPGLAAALGDIATGKHISAVKLEGVSTNGDSIDAVYDLTLTDVLLTSVHDGRAGADLLEFDGFKKMGLITHGQTEHGTTVDATSFGFDLGTGKTIDPVPLPTPVAGVGPASTPASKFFLLIDGVDGGSKDAEHRGWFEIDNYSFALSLPTTTSGDVGKTQFSPLSVIGNLDPGLATLLSSIADGGRISSVRVEGVTAQGNAVYDLTLANVMTQIYDSNGFDLVTFDNYTRMGLVTHTENELGKLVADSSFGFDIVGNRLISGSSLPDPHAGSEPASTSASKYFLLVDGLNGGSTDEHHKGWFEIDAYQFAVEETGTLAGGGGGATGRTNFSPLNVVLTLDPDLTGALDDITHSAHISAVKIEGVTVSGDAVYDLTLTDTSLTLLQDGNSGDVLTFGSYRKIGLITRAQKPDGSTGAGSSFGFDIPLNKSIDPTTLPSPVAAHHPADSSASKFFLLIDGLDGGSTDVHHKGWFEVDSYSLNVQNPELLGGGSAGEVRRANATLSVAVPNLDPSLGGALDDIATSKHISVVKLEGVTDSGDAVYDLVLTKALVTKVHDGSDGDDELHFDNYESLSLVTGQEQPHAPVAADVSQDANEDTGNPVTITASFTDPDSGDTHSFSLDTTGTQGTVVNNGDGTFSYDPDGLFEYLAVGASASDVFHYTVTDGSGESSTAQATITIHGENDAPAVLPDVAGVQKLATLSRDAAHGVLANDSDPDQGDTLSLNVGSFGGTAKSIAPGGSATFDGVYGKLTLHSDGSYDYVAGKVLPKQGLAQDIFAYTATDGHGGNEQSTLTITVSNDAYFAGTPGGSLLTGNSKQILDGSLGQQILMAGNGADVLIGGPGDLLIGGNGSDTFIFNAGFGRNTITDFNPKNELIQFDHNVFATAQDVMAHLTSNVFGDAKIIYDAESSVTLTGVSLGSIHAGDFLMV